ncbi:hypothetical protein KFL_005880030 [Klebsormidium nitens]|uniref:Pentatricopeptide repeat domain containing protein n=1 Tax=Klebsormidium nitens TaxID=105231 RepID=A0A1Y1IGL2_KLENI|nr:hypothetical protein KFL_005880030 [Klebsormidium nitens]|eukprot:GAQ90000.1 hypothetical protein KFL_005880030 [Klebsormidium nitens]
MWEAYQLGKQFEGTFSPEVVRYMLYALTRADRIPHVEEVLADYYRSLDASALSHSMTVIGESVFHCLFEMYIRAGQSDKVVEMFKEMVMRKLHIRPYFSLAWYKRLRKHGYHKEAEQLKALSVKRRRSNKVQLKSVYKY